RGARRFRHRRTRRLIPSGERSEKPPVFPGAFLLGPILRGGFFVEGGEKLRRATASGVPVFSTPVNVYPLQIKDLGRSPQALGDAGGRRKDVLFFPEKSPMLHGKKILVGVTGSIAAYKACDLVQRLKERGAEVRVAMTRDAARFVHENAFAALTGHPVLTDAWEGVARVSIPHIEAARWADLFVIAPCTAHTLAELSLGLTGSPVTMTALAYGGPLAVAPAMNTEIGREHV